MFLPPGKGKNWGAKKICQKTKLHVHTLLTSYHTSNLDHFWARYQLFYIFWHFNPKREHFWGCFYTLGGTKIGGRKIFCQTTKLYVHTLLTSYHTSNLDHFWARYQLFWHFFDIFLTTSTPSDGPPQQSTYIFETSIQHQEFLMTKTKISPSIQIYKKLKNHILQHLAKFHQIWWTVLKLEE